MSQVQFYKDYSWNNTPGVRKGGFNRQAVIERLRDCRQEWQEAAASDGKALTEIQAPVGVVLADFCDLLELSPEEREAVLGVELSRDTA